MGSEMIFNIPSCITVETTDIDGMMATRDFGAYQGPSWEPLTIEEQEDAFSDFLANFIYERNRIIIQAVSFLKLHCQELERHEVIEFITQTIDAFDRTYFLPRNCIDVVLTSIYGTPRHKWYDQGVANPKAKPNGRAEKMTRTAGRYMSQLIGQISLEMIPAAFVGRILGLKDVRPNPEACDSNRESKWYNFWVGDRRFESQKINASSDLLCSPTPDLSIINNKVIEGVYGRQQLQKYLGNDMITKLQIKTMCTDNTRWHFKTGSMKNGANELTFFTHYDHILIQKNIENCIPKNGITATSYLISLKLMQLCCQWAPHITAFENKPGWRIFISHEDEDLANFLHRGDLEYDGRPKDAEMSEKLGYTQGQSAMSEASKFRQCMHKLYEWDEASNTANRLPYGMVEIAKIDRNDLIEICHTVLSVRKHPSSKQFKKALLIGMDRFIKDVEKCIAGIS